ncbi:septation protein SpoVG family protein [uncultured Eubacterium sp.]|uniref:septation protein SpoVG family protein n=1 Tax=uncultured Eubacterium sp. TaxID=165185 RepID=UPI002639EDB8|nr:septation protein SpoVG family protein [uncultured Eubacterium sp.]
MAKSKKDYMERNFSAGSIRIYDGGKKRNDYGSISLDCGFVIYITIVETKKGRFISYPSYKTKKDEYINQAYCFDKDIIEELNDILEEMYDD